MTLLDARARRLRQPNLFPWAEPRTIRRARSATAPRGVRRTPDPPVCARCQTNEARYGFAAPDEIERPRTLCFECFRLELERHNCRATTRRRDDAVDVTAFATMLEALNRRRRRAQIAARHAMTREPDARPA